jgi:hypothetical protein
LLCLPVEHSVGQRGKNIRIRFYKGVGWGKIGSKYTSLDHGGHYLGYTKAFWEHLTEIGEVLEGIYWSKKRESSCDTKFG